MSEEVAQLLNFAESHIGYAAQRNLWFNEPVSRRYSSGSVAIGDINERIVEVPFAFRSLAGLPPGARILDVGATESLVSLSLCALGYHVTAVDPRPYPFEHPNLRVIVGAVEDWEPDETFDAILCISTVEHVGLGAYGEPTRSDRADLAAMKTLARCALPDATLVLTVPFGESAVGATQRIYDERELAALTAGWSVDERVTLWQAGAMGWTLAPQTVPDQRGVALVRARRMP